MAAPTRLIVAQRPGQPLEAICARLREWGCDLLDCSSHGAALAALGESADMVLIDAWLEGGMTLLTQVKADPNLRYLPVVIAAPEDAVAVAAHALALGADDVLVLPIEDAELFARVRALSRLASMELERRRREAVLSQFGVTPPPEMPGVPAIDRIGILLIGPAGGDQIQAMTALGGAATAAYAETAESALERLRRDDLDVALITGSRDHGDLQRLCAAIRADVDLFELPVLLIGRPDAFPDRALPFDWGVSDVLFQPFQPEVLRLRVQSWVRQQRLRRRLRGAFDGNQLPPTTDRLTRLHGHGYATGDWILAHLGGIIARTSRAEDLPARLGGDRFCVVIDGGSREDAATAGHRIASILTQVSFEASGGQRIGVAIATGSAELEPGDTAASLIGRAFAQLQPFGLRQAS